MIFKNPNYLLFNNLTKTVKLDLDSRDLVNTQIKLIVSNLVM